MTTHIFYILSKTIRQYQLRLLSLLILCWAMPAVQAQSCPDLLAKDFNVSLTAGNTDCNTPAKLAVSYRNNVVGFEKLVYEISKDNITFGHPVETTQPSAPTDIPLPGWNAGDHIYIHVTGHCSGSTATVDLPVLTYSATSAAAVTPLTEVFPSGGCTSSSGSIAVRLGGTSGYGRAEYRLYQNNEQIGFEESSTPYTPTSFYNLAAGEYKLRVRAFPTCTPAAPDATWKNGAYERETTVRVGYFSVVPTPIPSRGTCTGGVIIQAARVVGVTSITYEIFPKGGVAGGLTPLQTQTVSYPEFTHTFLGLAVGQYEIRATADCGVSELQPFDVVTGTPGTLKARALQNTYTPCSIGKIIAEVPGTTVACPVDYVLTPSGPGTPQTRTGITAESVVFDHLPKGTYTIKATWAGQTQTTTAAVVTASLGNLKLSATAADKVCDPTGTITVKLENGDYYESGILELALDGTAVRTISIKATEREKTISNLTPGRYTVTLKTECGEQISGSAYVDFKQKIKGMLAFPDMSSTVITEYCNGQDKPTYKLAATDGYGENSINIDEGTRTFWQGATYEFYNEDKELVGSGAVPAPDAQGRYWFATKEVGLLTVKIRPSCGFPVLSAYTNSYNYSIINPRLDLQQYALAPPCGNYGQAYLSSSAIKDINNTNIPYHLSLRRNSDNTMIYEKDVTEDVSEYLKNLQVGDYTCEWYPLCNPLQKGSKTFTMPSEPQFSSDYVTGSGPNYPVGTISVYLSGNAEGVTTTFTLKTESGTIIAENVNKSNFSKLLPGKYKLLIHRKSTATGCVLPDIEREYTVPTLPEPDIPTSLTVKKQKPCTDYCKDDGEVDLSLPAFDTYTDQPFTWYIINPKTNAVIASKQVTSGEEVVHFDHLPLQYKVKVSTTTGDFYANLTNYVQRPANAPALLETSSSNIYPGCQNGSITMKSHLKDLGYSDGPVKITLIKEDYPYYGQRKTITEKSFPNLVDEYEFNDLEAGRYSIVYNYCGSDITSYAGITAVMGNQQLYVYYQQTPPCSDGIVSASVSPSGKETQITYVFTNQLSGVETLRKTVTGGEQQKQFNLPVGKYDVEAIITGECGNNKLTGTVEVGAAKMNVYCNYPWNGQLTCPNNGKIELSVSAPGKLTKVRYTLQKGSSGTPIAAETTTPQTPVAYTGLTAGEYTVKAVGSCTSADGTYTEYPWEQKVKLTSNYTNLTAYPAPAYTIPSPTCTAAGGIGLNIQGGYNQDLKVFLTSGPNGVISPAKEIKKRRDDYSNYTTWGSDLAPGNYSARVTDGCMDVNIPTLTIPSIVDPAIGAGVSPFDKSQGFVYLNDDCDTYNFYAYIKFPNYATAEELRKYADQYEIAAVPKGKLPKRVDWKTDFTYRYSHDNITGQDYYNYAEVNTNITPIFALSQGIDVYIRIKGCPATMRKFHVPVKRGTAIDIDSNESNCEYHQFYFYHMDCCRAVDAIITRTSDNQQVLKKQNVTYPCGSYIYDPDFKLPLSQGYVLKIYDHDTQELLATETMYARTPSYAVRITTGIGDMTTDCTGETYILGAQSDCGVQGKFIVYDGDSGVKLGESDGYSKNSWDCPIKFIRNKRYLVDFVRENGTSYLTAKAEIRPTYVTPSSYVHGDIAIGNYCNDERKSIIKDIGSQWPAGTPEAQKRLPRILKIEIIAADGTSRVSTKIRWTQRQGYSNFGYISGSDFRTYNSHGQPIQDSYPGQIPPGTYTLRITDDCGVKTSTFKVTFAEPSKIDMNNTTVVMQCDGQFVVTPKGRAYFPDRNDPITIESFSNKGTTYPYGQSFKTYNTNEEIYVNLKFADGNTCSRRWYYDLSRYALHFDDSQSASFFCSGTNKGQISMAVAGGRPPYTYVLKKLDGTIVETKANLPGAAYFEQGQQGESYRIEATDACGLTHIYQDVKIQDPKVLGYAMDRTYSFCDGEASTFSALNIPGATYNWTYPNGTHSTNREVSIVASSATAGEYKVTIHPGTCTTTINATIRVNVARVKESWKKQTKRVCSGQSVTFNIDKPTVLTNGTPSNTHKYQWQMSTDTTDASKWRGIAGATQEQLTYAPPYTGTYYLRRLTIEGSCTSASYASTVIVDPGLNSTISPDELNVVIDHKDPFTLTAGFLTGNPNRTYQWQRSTDKATWVNVGTDVTFTETKQYASKVYYRRITTAGTCTTESPIITVHFKKRYPALINPQLRQRAVQP